MYINPTWSPQNLDNISLNTFKMIVCPKISIFVLRFFGGARFNMYLGVLYIFNQYTRHLTQLQFQGRSTSVFNSISCPKPWTLQKTQGPRFQTCPRRWRFLVVLNADLPVPELSVGGLLAPLKASRWLRIGFVGQEPVLFNTTVRANLMYGLDESDTHVNDEYVRKCLFLRIWSMGRVAEVSDMDGLGDLVMQRESGWCVLFAPPQSSRWNPKWIFSTRIHCHQILLHSDFHPLHFGSRQTWRQIRSWQILLVGLIACMILKVSV